MPIDPSTAFVSYSREDLEFVLRLAKDLKGKGAKVWMDKLDILPGQPWDDKVETAVEQCERMIVVLSPTSVASAKVKNEFMDALDLGKLVIPVLFRECKIPQQLKRLQYADFREDYDTGVAELLASFTALREATQSATADQVRIEGERQRIAAEQARLDEERKHGVAEQARLEQEERERKGAEEKARQEELERQRVAAEQAWFERKERERKAAEERTQQEEQERQRIAAEQAHLDRGGLRVAAESTSRDRQQRELRKTESTAQPAPLGPLDWLLQRPIRKVTATICGILIVVVAVYWMLRPTGHQQNNRPQGSQTEESNRPPSESRQPAAEATSSQSAVPAVNPLASAEQKLPSDNEWTPSNSFTSKPNGVKLELLRTLKQQTPEERAWGLTFSPDGRLLASAWQEITIPVPFNFKGNGSVHIWNVTTGELLSTLVKPALTRERPADQFASVAFSPDGRFIAASTAVIGPSFVEVWEVSSGKPVATLSAKDGLRRLAFSPDSASLAAACDDYSVRIWAVPSGTLVRTLKHPDIVVSVAFNPRDGDMLAAGDYKQSVRIWNVSTGTLVKVLRSTPPSYGEAVSFSQDGQILATGHANGSLVLWDTRNWQMLRTMRYKNPINGVSSVAFTPNDQLLAAASDESTLRFWDPHNGRLIGSFDISGSSASTSATGAVVAFDPRQRLLATTISGDSIQIWKLVTY